MYTKILLIAVSIASLSSCSTAYKSGQTPDDVYYSPVRAVDETQNKEDDKNKDEAQNQTPEDREIRWGIRDRRWRDFNDDYDYSYRKSPYGYCTCTCNNYGYYYNPYYSPWPVYSPKITPRTPINSTPRMINLNAYNGYAVAGTSKNPKTGNTTVWVQPARQYNNSNNDGSGVGKVIRQIFSPSSNSNNTGKRTENNNTRTYTPSTNNNSSSGSSSSGSGSSGTTVTRPGRGG